jgi:hypothetical protein
VITSTVAGPRHAHARSGAVLRNALLRAGEGMAPAFFIRKLKMKDMKTRADENSAPPLNIAD